MAAPKAVEGRAAVPGPTPSRSRLARLRQTSSLSPDIQRSDVHSAAPPDTRDKFLASPFDVFAYNSRGSKPPESFSALGSGKIAQDGNPARVMGGEGSVLLGPLHGS